MDRKYYDHCKAGSHFYTYTFPPKVDKEAADAFGEDLIPMIEEKLKELVFRKEEIERDTSRE